MRDREPLGQGWTPPLKKMGRIRLGPQPRRMRDRGYGSITGADRIQGSAGAGLQPSEGPVLVPPIRPPPITTTSTGSATRADLTLNRLTTVASYKRAIEQLYTAPPPGSAVLCLDEMGPQASRSYPGRQLVRPAPPKAERAKQEIDYGRRGGRPATSSAPSSRPRVRR